MTKLHFNYHLITKGALVREVEEVLGYKGADVELYGVSMYDEKLPDNYQIVGYGSRETLLVCENGVIIDDPEEIAKWEEKQFC